MAMTPIRRIVATTIHGHYLIRQPANGCVPRGVLVGFHGYALNAEDNMRDLLEIPGTNDWMVCSVQALHRFYNSKTREIGASWMTNEDREHMIHDNVEFIEEILEDIDLEYPDYDVDDCLVFAGFSQGASMAYRAADMCHFAAAGLIIIGGDIPPEFSEEDIASLPPVLMGRGKSDPLFTQERMDRDVHSLNAQNIPVTTSVFTGGHEWKKPFYKAAGTFLFEVSNSNRFNGAQIVEIPQHQVAASRKGELPGKSQVVETTATVLLKDIADALDFVCDEMTTFLRRDTGEIIQVPDEVFEVFASDDEHPEWMDDFADIDDIVENESRYVSLPTRIDIDEYSIMERFCLGLADPEVRENMCGVIRGQGAFRRFKDFAHRFGIIEEWYDFRFGSLMATAREWCKDNGIPYQD